MEDGRMLKDIPYGQIAGGKRRARFGSGGAGQGAPGRLRGAARRGDPFRPPDKKTCKTEELGYDTDSRGHSFQERDENAHSSVWSAEGLV
ncbi:hypothetical protein Y1Q_0005463 [Alligator mississippiensis]|uniref:Uncharacterized protein n=1 Tax=Alligator mississippiensis TaxID=8496 RepID=A0A151MEM4_ALLMI|nr:hypothetical protein Y1Q_0005463 [Alligator mississippiensis]